MLETNRLISNPETRIETKSNPMNQYEKCILINTKKTRYYTHTYDPTNVLRYIRSLNVNDEALLKFDDKIRYNCCNVISISLYFTELVNSQVMKKYLFSINQTIKKTILFSSSKINN